MHEETLNRTVQKMLIPRLQKIVDDVKVLPWRENWDFRMCWLHEDASEWIPPRIGFTGARGGMMPSQRAVLAAIIDMTHPKEFHEGDCVGADAEAAYMCHELNAIAYDFRTNDKRYLYNICIVSHPPEDPKARAYVAAHKEFPEMPYLARNRSIVDCCDFMVATPSTGNEVKRSGTWYTIRCARRKHKPLLLIQPDGFVSLDGGYYERENYSATTKFEVTTELANKKEEVPPITKDAK